MSFRFVCNGCANVLLLDQKMKNLACATCGGVFTETDEVPDAGPLELEFLAGPTSGDLRFLRSIRVAW